MSIFDHIQIKVKDLSETRAFYDAIMDALDLKIVFEEPGVVIGYGTNTHDMFEIRQATGTVRLSEAVHIAFAANSRKAVDDFYEIALKNGAICNGQPGLRDYEPGYYAAFIIDPNGHNLEAVFSDTE